MDVKTLSDKADRKLLLARANRVVVKLGTAVLMREEGGLSLARFYSFVEAIADQIHRGKEVLLVTSGAIGLGAQRLSLAQKPKLLPIKQACAAIGQSRLMAFYSEAFEQLGITTAQILLTEEDFSNRKRYLNLRSTIAQLLELGVLPIINENDTVSTAELEADKTATRKVNFGDNDKLSALVASKVEADLLVILTDVDGLYSADPRVDASATLISEVDDVDQVIDEMALQKPADNPSKLGRGGMQTKLQAAKIATQSGCATIIAGGKLPLALGRVFEGESLGTLFLPHPGFTGKQRWIAFATTVKAALVVNSGAQEALVKRKASLLPAGVTEVRDSFERGDVVSILDSNGHEFARGIVNYSSIEARKISGLHSDAIDGVIEDRNYDALITRDNLVFLEHK
jgi:glutamate 5-kinase